MRKPLMIVSGLLMFFFMITLAAAVHFKEQFYAGMTHDHIEKGRPLYSTLQYIICEVQLHFVDKIF